MEAGKICFLTDLAGQRVTDHKRDKHKPDGEELRMTNIVKLSS
jgi:hypothetical protein